MMITLRGLRYAGRHETFFAVVLVFVVLAAPSLALAQDIYGSSGAPLVAEVLGTQIHTSDPDEMESIILGKLLDKYAADNGIDVQQADIDAYLESMSRAAEQDRKRDKERREEIIRKLASKTLPDAERDSLSSELENLNQILQIDAEAKSATAQDSEEVKAAMQQMASAFIRQWKINRALYRQYGGRIIFQQGGPEPLDAYREFLKEQQHKGAFNILHKAFEPNFWRYFVTDSIHSFYAAGSEEEAQAFETPWWLLDESQGIPR